jgi:hypothetical protein
MADDPMESLHYEAKILDNLVDEMLPHLRKLTSAARFDANGPLQTRFRDAGIPPSDARSIARDIAARADRIHQAMKSASDGVVASIAEFRDALDRYQKALEAQHLIRTSTGRHHR